MNFTLKRQEYRSDGVFGTMVSEDGSAIFCTLEHAYQDGAAWVPKVAAGTYKCTLHPPERLKYTTFMLQSVPAFQSANVLGILIHILNFDAESEGCIGVGESESIQPNGQKMIDHSAAAFSRFMGLQQGITEFELTVIS